MTLNKSIKTIKNNSKVAPVMLEDEVASNPFAFADLGTANVAYAYVN